MVDYLPFPIYINHRDTLKHEFFSKSFYDYGDEVQQLYEKGIAYLPTIAEPFLLQTAKDKASKFSSVNDHDTICSYLQCLSLNKKMTSFFTNKCLIDDKLTINTNIFPNQQNAFTKLFDVILPESQNSLVFWQRFQSLTKQEKLILNLVTNGFHTKEIGEQLFISSSTVKTHRRNIFKKLDAHNLGDLIKFSLVLELF
jgi:DNA-binding CsgD family transcriptional regulator